MTLIDNKLLANTFLHFVILFTFCFFIFNLFVTNTNLHKRLPFFIIILMGTR